MAGKKITLDEARKLIKNYRGNGNTGKLHSLTIDADHIRRIIDQKDCKYVRFHIAKDNAETSALFDASHTMIITGVDSNEKVITENNEVYEDLARCPPICPVEDEF